MDRKAIVKALSDHFAVKPNYLGAPSFTYQFETAVGIYSIDRTGKITSSKGTEVELDSLLNEPTVVELAESLEPVDQVASKAPVEPPASAIAPLEIAVPLEGHTGLTLRNLVNLICSKQVLIRKSLGIEGDIIKDEFAKAINEQKKSTHLIISRLR